jgi:uncharacterized Zn finger protein (UPF0148 family)
MFWSEIAFMLFPTRLCPACDTRHIISRSSYLCPTCEEKAHAFISQRKSPSQGASVPVKTVDSSMNGTAMQALRSEVEAFVSAAEAVLAPPLLTSPLNDDERGTIRMYLRNLEILVSQAKATSSANR